MKSGTHLTPQRKVLRDPLLHVRRVHRPQPADVPRTAEALNLKVCPVRAHMRCLRPGGIAVGREMCARSVLRRIITYSQILRFCGVRLLYVRCTHIALRLRATRPTRATWCAGGRPSLARGKRLVCETRDSSFATLTEVASLTSLANAFVRLENSLRGSQTPHTYHRKTCHNAIDMCCCPWGYTIMFGLHSEKLDVKDLLI